VRFDLLGPLVVVGDAGSEVRVSAARQRALLAALLLQANQPVPSDALAEVVWDGSPPPGYPVTLRSYVMRLRHTLGPPAAARLVTRPPGYLFELDPGELDVSRFEALCRQAGAAIRSGAWAETAGTATRALALWRAAPLVDIASETLRAVWVLRLDELYLQALAWRAEAELRLGNYERMVPELRDLTARYPLRENLQAALVRALAGAGQRAQALEAYQRARRVLVDELGVDPGPELSAAQQAVLAQPGPDRTAVTPPGAATLDGRSPVPVRQLPPAVRHFVGRGREFAILSMALDETRPGGTALIWALTGTAGIGKTTLAVHWAHQVADRFPDGQLYVNLRGHEPSVRPMAPNEAIRGFLDTLGVAPQHVPTTAAAQIALYRTLLADRRVLVVLDNARDAEQVRPLLPAGPHCVAVVTSRTQLTPLVATDAAQLIDLDLLSAAEAVELLAHRIGRHRTTEEPAATSAIATHCARLPLALAIAAARAVTRPNARLAALAGELADARTSLSTLSVGDPGTDMRAVFSWSYRTLSPQAARLFRLLAVHPRPDLPAGAAASLAGAPADRVQPMLDELMRAHLVTEHVPGRYACHDLLYAYAAELTHQIDSRRDCDLATRRLLDHYLHTARFAAQELELLRDPLPFPVPDPMVTVEHPAGAAQAVAWFTSGQAVLTAAVSLAASAELDVHAWQLAWILAGFLDRRGYWQEQLAAGNAALASARRAADPTGQAYAHRLLARANTRLGHFEDAYQQLDAALAIYRQLGDQVGQAQIHRNLGQVCERHHRPADALHHVRQAYELYRVAGHKPGQAHALNAIGFCQVLLGQYGEAVGSCREALTLHQALDDREGQAATWDSLGYAYHHLGQHDEAVICYEQALALQRELGGRYNQAEILHHLGDARLARRAIGPARRAWQQALSILEDLGHADAERVRGKLVGLDAAAAPPDRDTVP
jgi:DNA-binding SARP family transcriptional activator/Tfp pilus assembly protein PilF